MSVRVEGRETSEYRSQLQATLAARVTSAMRERGWSQAELADRAGITQKHLSRILNGRDEGALSLWDALLRQVGEQP